MATQPMVMDDQVDPGMDDKTVINLTEAMSGVLSRLQRLADEQVGLKATIEDRWIENMRAYHGVYDPDTETKLRHARKSRAFVKVTRKKTNAWDARLQDLIFPTDDRNWGIQPTPVPKLTKQAAAAQAKAQKATQQANAAMPADPQADPASAQQAQAIAAQGQQHADQASQAESDIEAAKIAADGMQDVMDDQLVECQYAQHGRDAIRDACRLGTGIIKGPLSGDRTRGTWKLGADGITAGWTYERDEDPAPVFVRVNPWAYFPDMSAGKPEEAEFEFERHLWSKKDLRRKVRESGFNPDAVRRLIEGERRPTAGIGLRYLNELRGMTGEGDSISGRYVGWEYHGPLEINEIASIMRAMALVHRNNPEAYQAALDAVNEYEDKADPLDERRVIVHFCEGEILKFAPDYALDSGESLYSVFPFEEGEWSIFGYGVPEIMGDSQRAINGGWRMAIDNAALSVGPQILIDKTSIEPQDGNWELQPRKIWRIVKQMVQGQPAPFQAIDIPQNINEILTIVREAHGHADDETALPTISEGEMPEQGAAQTRVADMSRQSGSNVTFRRVVKAYDDGITAPSMRRLYDWNMQHSSRDDIKGDMSIDARGTSVLLLKDIQSQMLMGITTNWTTHPVLGAMIKPYESAKKTLQAMSISPDDILKTKDEYEKFMDEQAKTPPPPTPQEITAKANVERANIDAKTAVEVANINQMTELSKVAQMHNMSIEQLKARLQEVQMHVDSKERIFAAESAVEQQMAQMALDHGNVPGGSGGSISAGEKPSSKVKEAAQ